MISHLIDTCSQPSARSAGRKARLGLACLAMILAAGCVAGPTLVKNGMLVDRRYTDYPANTEMRRVIENLTGATAIAFRNDQTPIVAESGTDGTEPKIITWKNDKLFVIYPTDRRIPFSPIQSGFRIYGPVTGLAADSRYVYAAHRDETGNGVITRFDYAGDHRTLIANIPSHGDYGLTDMALAPNEQRIYFGVGSATNSGVVGLDNEWIKHYPKFCDESANDLVLRGSHFQTKNPFATIFSGNDIAVTGPYQPFGDSIEDTIPRVNKIDKSACPTGCICSISLNGGDLRVEASGLRYPRGLGFNGYGRLHFTDEGMELRGTRPVKDDPDALYKFVSQAWYGWPDYSRSLKPITDPFFQPPSNMIINTGYQHVTFVIDQAASGLQPPNRDLLLVAELTPLSGAAKFDFCPDSGFFKKWQGDAVVALFGDRAPFATSGMPLKRATGYKVVRIDHFSGAVEDFVRNTTGEPASRSGRDQIGLERPIDVKFGPDGAMYIVDFGTMEMRGGQEKIAPRSGAVYRLSGISDAGPTTSGSANR